MLLPESVSRGLCWSVVLAALAVAVGLLGGALSEDMDLFDVLGENHRFGSRFEAAAGSGVVVEIRNAFGAVDVAAGEDGRITVDLEKTVRAASREQAGALEGELRFTVEEEEGVLRIASNREELSVRTRQRLRTSLRVRVPRDAPVRIYNESGRVRVEAAAGDVAIRGDHVDVEVGLPRSAGFSLEVSAGDGVFESDFAAFAGRADRERPVAGRVGAGGLHIDIQVRRGAVRLGER